MTQTKRWADRPRRTYSPEVQAAAQRNIERMERDYAVTLAGLRKAREMTQVELAREMGLGQGDISRIERQSDLLFSTLRRIVHSLGGELELNARFGDETYRIEIGDILQTEPAPASQVT